MSKINERFYQCVASNSSETYSYTPPSGEILEITEIGGDAGTSPDTVVQVWWDKAGGQEELLFSTHGDTTQSGLSIKNTGDGSKKIEIILVNDQAQEDCLGAYFNGEQYGG